jgi:hypothetical protein
MGSSIRMPNGLIRECMNNGDDGVPRWSIAAPLISLLLTPLFPTLLVAGDAVLVDGDEQQSVVLDGGHRVLPNRRRKAASLS